MAYSPELTTLGFVLSPDGRQVLMVHRIGRSDDEQLGKWNGLGGKVEADEDVWSGMARELREEAGIELDAAALRHLRTVSTPDGGSVLIFGAAPALAELPAWEANHEVSERVVVTAPCELAFSLHTDVLRDWFGGKQGSW